MIEIVQPANGHADGGQETADRPGREDHPHRSRGDHMHKNFGDYRDGEENQDIVPELGATGAAWKSK